MRLYVVVEELYHDSGSIFGLFTTINKARETVDNHTEGTVSRWEEPKEGPPNPDPKYSQPGKGLCVCWLPDPPTHSGWEGVHHEWYSVYEWDVQGDLEEPIQAFALSVLRDDPMACDAVRDILRL